MELVQLVDASGNPTGSAPKHSVHTADTPLHLGFSCWVIGADGRMLLTRRALSKLTWPGVWTNAFCGHPAPGEPTEDAVYRRAEFELGLPRGAFASLGLAVADFRYRAVDASGVVENEICPVFVARLVPAAAITPNPEEVAERAWADPAQVFAAAEAAPFLFSPWLVEEMAQPALRSYLAGSANSPRT